MSRLYDDNYNPMFPDDEDFKFIDQIRQDREEQDAKFDTIVRESIHRREIMMAQKIIDENTLCLAGVEPCESCQRELDKQ